MAFLQYCSYLGFISVNHIMEATHLGKVNLHIAVEASVFQHVHEMIKQAVVPAFITCLHLSHVGYT